MKTITHHPSPTGVRPPRRAAFTLIEMLTVITIIGILAAMLFPAISAAIKKAKVARARSEVQTIANAVRQYYTEYGKYPDHNGTSGDWNYGTSGESNYKLLNILRALDAAPNTGHSKNLRRIVFIEVPLKSIDSNGNYLDPWDKQYQVTIDVDFDNTCENLNGGYDDVTNAYAAAWSYGADGLSSSAKEREDNVASWR